MSGALYSQLGAGNDMSSHRMNRSFLFPSCFSLSPVCLFFVVVIFFNGLNLTFSKLIIVYFQSFFFLSNKCRQAVLLKIF